MVRLVSGLVLAAAALAAISLLDTFWLGLIATAVAALAGFEYSRVVGSRSLNGLLAGIFCFWVSVGAFDGNALAAILLVAGFCVSIAVLAGDTVQQAAAEMYGPIYVGVPLGLLVLVHALGGRDSVLLLLFSVVASDSAQYYSGRAFGRRPLAPAISPKKTVEGAVGGVIVGTAVFAAGARQVLPFTGVWTAAAMGAVIVGLGIAGDLFESRLKRAAGVKDSSTLIPGHGGALDRIDALLFATPAFYVFLHEVM